MIHVADCITLWVTIERGGHGSHVWDVRFGTVMQLLYVCFATQREMKRNRADLKHSG